MSAPEDIPRLLSASPAACEGWTEAKPALMRFAQFWSNRMPRGRGWVPRVIGRHFARKWKCAIRTSDGVLLAVDPTALEVYTAIIREGGWEPNVLRACCALLTAGQVFYDIGANVGFMSISVAAAFKNHVEVISFEPQSTLAEHIALSAGLNQITNLQIFPIMLGKEDSYAEFFLANNPIHSSQVARARNQSHIKCLVFRLDGLIDSQKIPPPDVIKMDVEGAELQVIHGAAKTIARYSPVIIFESDANADRFGYQRGDIMDFIASCAPYRFLVATEKGLIDPQVLDDASYRDIVAIPAARNIETIIKKSQLDYPAR